MRISPRLAPALLAALSLTVLACGGGDRGAMEDLEQSVADTDLAPDTAVPGAAYGPGAGSVADTMEASPSAADSVPL